MVSMAGWTGPIWRKRLYDKAVRGAAAIIERPVWTVIPDVRTKLAVTAHLAEGDLAERLERALARSQKTRLIEHRRGDDSWPHRSLAIKSKAAKLMKPDCS